MGATVKPTVIPATECIGNSLYTINTNFARLYTGISLLESFQGETKFNGVVKSTTTSGLTAAIAGIDYAPGTAALASGLIKSTTGTGVLARAIPGTDYFVPGSSLVADNVTFSGSLSVQDNTILNGTTINGVLSASNRTFFGSGGNKINATQSICYGDFESTGKMYASGTAVTSDARLKTKIQSIDYPLTKLEQLRGVTFEWVKTCVSDIGVIAQEVEPVLPEAIETIWDEESKQYTKYVAYNKIIPLLIESVKALKAEVDYLRSRVDQS